MFCSTHMRLMLALYSIPCPGGILLSFGVFFFFFFWTRLIFYTLLLALVLFLPHPALVPRELSCSYSSCATFVTPSCLPTFLPFNLLPRHLLLLHSLPGYPVLLPPVWAICCMLWGLSISLPALWYISCLPCLTSLFFQTLGSRWIKGYDWASVNQP